MKVIVCDRCGVTLLVGDKGIYGAVILSEVLVDVSFNTQGVEVDLLNGVHFCSVKCVNESLK